MYAKGTIIAAVSTVLILGAWRAPGDACALLTQTEVNSAMGLTLQDGAQQGTPLNCAWTEANSPKSTHKRIDLSLQDPQGFAIGKTPLREKTMTPVSGIGDDAYYVEMLHVPTTLSVKKGGAAFVIIVRGEGLSTDQTKAMEKALAQDALARL
jgi:hypothetical protein